MTRELTTVDSELPDTVGSGLPNDRLLRVHLLSEVREELRKRQSQLREIDAKKTRVDRHTDVVSDKVSELRSRLATLNGRMASTKTRLLARISECSSMSADVEQFNRKYSDLPLNSLV